MFVFSVKASKKKFFIVLAVILLVVTSIIVVNKVHNSQPTATSDGKSYVLSAGTNEERVAFLQQFGWKVNPEPIEIKDVAIPQEFSDVYVQYNNVQKEQGLDLEPYAGKTCKQWVYCVTNYPQVTDIRASLLVFDNKVVGGDLSTAELDGFMTGFNGEKPSNDYSLTTMNPNPNAVEDNAKPKVSSEVPANAWPTD